MAIKNASDLLVYAKTTNPAKQVTRIYVKTTDPLEMPDGATQGNVKINNVTNGSGVVKDDVTTNNANNTAASLLSKIAGVLVTNNNYIQTSSVVSGDYTYRDFTNFAVGLVPTLEIVSGTATLNEGAIIIEIITPGSSAIFDPVAFSTSASFSTNMDLRDITNKDSGGWSESLGGLRSFEVSTDILQSINPDVPLDGTDFFDKLKARSLVDLSFSDRIRNIIRTNLTQSGVDNFVKSDITQNNVQADPFSGSTASKIEVATSGNYRNLNYLVDATRLDGKNVTWTFYVKADNTSSVTFYADIVGGSDIAPDKIEILEGTQTSSDISNSNKTLGSLNSTYTRIRLTYNNIFSQSFSSVAFRVLPGASQTGQTSGDSVITSSWQIEFSPDATDYQDPTDITHWQGNALVSSVSFDAGVEDNLTCSATFTGTGNVYPNGLGPELIADTGFNDTTYWDVNDSAAGASSVIQNGYGKIITNGDYTDISKDGILTAGDTYSLTYKVHTNSVGGISIGDVYGDGAGSGGVDLNLQATAGQTYTVQFKANISDLIIKRVGETTIWLSSISLKKVL